MKKQQTEGLRHMSLTCNWIAGQPHPDGVTARAWAGEECHRAQIPWDVLPARHRAAVLELVRYAGFDIPKAPEAKGCPGQLQLPLGSPWVQPT